MARRRKQTELGVALDKVLSERGLTQYRAAATANVSQPHFNQVIGGSRKASAEWLDTVAKALALSPEEQINLHRAAAKDHGFKIDLTKK